MSDDPSGCQRWGPVHLVFEADALAVRAALGTLLASLPKGMMSPDCRGSAEIVVAEALNNVVEHAYPGGHGKIALSVREGAEGLICEIRDHGAPMPKGVLPDGALPSVDHNGLPEGGFGWHMIRTLARDLQYTRHAETNLLRFVLPAHQTDPKAAGVARMAPMP